MPNTINTIKLQDLRKLFKEFSDKIIAGKTVNNPNESSQAQAYEQDTAEISTDFFKQRHVFEEDRRQFVLLLGEAAKVAKRSFNAEPDVQENNEHMHDFGGAGKQR